MRRPVSSRPRMKVVMWTVWRASRIFRSSAANSSSPVVQKMDPVAADRAGAPPAEITVWATGPSLAAALAAEPRNWGKSWDFRSASRRSLRPPKRRKSGTPR